MRRHVAEPTAPALFRLATSQIFKPHARHERCDGGRCSLLLTVYFLVSAPLIKGWTVAATLGLPISYNLAPSLVEVEHDGSGIVHGVRTGLHKIWRPGISRRPYFLRLIPPHGALYHDMISAVQSACSSSIERCFQFKTPPLARAVARTRWSEATERRGAPSATAHNTSRIEDGVAATPSYGVLVDIEGARASHHDRQSGPMTHPPGRESLPKKPGQAALPQR
jgi:hypothetical protein